MSNTIRNVLGIVLVVGIIGYVGSELWTSYNYNRSTNPNTFRTFSATAEGKVETAPDLAEFTLSVVTEGDTDITALQKANTEKMNKVIGFLRAKGIEEKDIRTYDYRLDARYQSYNCAPSLPQPMPVDEARPEQMDQKAVCPPPSIAGYTINQTVGVKIRNFDVIGEVLAGATTNGANAINGPSFTIENKDEYLKQAREIAIQKARAKADDIARSAGFSLGRLISIDEDGGYGYYADGKGGYAESAAPSTPMISPGTQEVRLNVTLRFEMK